MKKLIAILIILITFGCAGLDLKSKDDQELDKILKESEQTQKKWSD